jgi:hypothetical protein
MPSNYVLLSKSVVGAAGASSVTFSNIPQTGYTDLVVKVSARSNRGATEDGFGLAVNNVGSGYTYKILYGEGAGANVATTSFEQTWATRINGDSTTSNTYTNAEFYFPNYTSSIAKVYSGDAVTENNSGGSYQTFSAIKQSSTSAITSLVFSAINATLMQYSTFYLYGVASYGVTPAIAPYATGGDTITTDGTYWYHAFKATGTFTPRKSISCDVLVVAGGGSGGSSDIGGGGGGGGLVYSATNSLTATNYTVTVGAGAAANANGTNSQFTGLTAAVGGGKGAGADGDGFAGGSGGGAGKSYSTSRSGGTATSGQGNAGGGNSGGDGPTGGGGGAGAVGGAGSGSANGVSGNGGAGSNAYSTWASATSTGVGGYYAGGGGGGARSGGTNGTGGSGGGGAGSKVNDVAGVAGTSNTGGGGGGSGIGYGYFSTGGSGIVIVRYPI